MGMMTALFQQQQQLLESQRTQSEQLHTLQKQQNEMLKHEHDHSTKLPLPTPSAIRARALSPHQNMSGLTEMEQKELQLLTELR